MGIATHRWTRQQSLRFLSNAWNEPNDRNRSLEIASFSNRFPFIPFSLANLLASFKERFCRDNFQISFFSWQLSQQAESTKNWTTRPFLSIFRWSILPLVSRCIRFGRVNPGGPNHRLNWRIAPLNNSSVKSTIELWGAHRQSSVNLRFPLSTSFSDHFLVPKELS